MNTNNIIVKAYYIIKILYKHEIIDLIITFWYYNSYWNLWRLVVVRRLFADHSNYYY